MVGAGLHEGLARLVQGGVPPRLLIIDDGWQCTDVDPPLRPPMPDLPLPKKVAERVQETLLSTKDEFVEAELEMLYMGTKDIPAGSELGPAPPPPLYTHMASIPVSPSPAPLAPARPHSWSCCPSVSDRVKMGPCGNPKTGKAIAMPSSRRSCF